MIFGRGGGGGMLNRVLKEADGVPINEWKVQTGSYNNARVSGDVGGKITDTFTRASTGCSRTPTAIATTSTCSAAALIRR